MAEQFLMVKKKHPSQTPCITPEDIALFRQSVGEVTRLPEPAQVVIQSPQGRNRPVAKAPARQSKLLQPNPLRLDPNGLVSTETPSGLNGFVRPGHSADVLKKLAQEYWVVRGHLDLHGYTQTQTHDQLETFMQQALQRRWRCVCIIHGQGFGSRQGASVLKQLTIQWLRHQAVVQAFTPAPDNWGGAGAQMVLLQKQPRG